MTDEYAAYRDEPGDNFKAVLRSLADEYLEADALVAQKEQELEVAKAARKDIAEVRIPQATEGMDGKFDLGDGRELQLKEEIRASIAGEKRGPAIKWLDEHDYGHIVKRQVIIEFGKGEQERTEQFLKAVKALEDQLGTLVVKTNFSVHNATLVSWVKEQLSEGVDLPVDVFGIYRQRTAKVKEL
jgi:hypothetical protein